MAKKGKKAKTQIAKLSRANPTRTLTVECRNGASFPAEVMKQVAPERAEQLAAILTDLGITFRIDKNVEDIHFRADSQSNVILVGTKCLSRLWVHAFAYFTIFTDLVPLKVSDPEAPLSLRGSDRLRKAAALLKWAVKADLHFQLGDKNEVDSSMASLPSEIEPVFSDKQFAVDKRFADRHATIALGFILHHELAHIRLGHTATKELLSIEQEKDADRAAADWLLGSPDLDGRELLKRQLGVTIALGWLASRNVYIGHSSKTHPPAWDRLYQILEQYVENDHAIAWAFAAAMLGVHLENQRRSEIDMEREFSSFKEAVSYDVDVLSRLS